MKSIDITGRKYGRLTAVKVVGHYHKTGEEIWQFKCDCGNTIELVKGTVTSGLQRSCGCLQNEVRKKAGEKTRIRQKNGILNKRNNTGYAGINYTKSGNYMAQLTYKGKKYATMRATLESAVRWRKALEQELGIYTEEGIKA